MSLECYSLLDYIKMHRESDCCWDCSDTVFDAVVTVDCYVDRDGHVDIVDDEDKEFPHMPLFIREFLSKVEVKSLMSDGTPVIDVDGLIRHNIDKVRQWIPEHWQEQWWNASDDDIVYAMIQEIHYAIAGYKGEKGYTDYYNLFKNMTRTDKKEATK